MEVELVSISSREGKRRDGSPAIYYNAAVILPNGEVGTIGVTQEIAKSLNGTSRGTRLAVGLVPAVWNGRVEFRVDSLRPVGK